jgi:hypothetical protein
MSPQSARRPVWLFVRRSRSGRTDPGLQNSSFADRKTDFQSVGFSLNGSHLALQNCMSLIPRTKHVPESEFEFARKRSFNNIERTAGTVKQLEDDGKHANGSQTDHGSGSLERPTKATGTLVSTVSAGLYLHPRGMLAIQSLRLPPPFRGLVRYCPIARATVGSTDFDE